jgi:hypothetical protein
VVLLSNPLSTHTATHKFGFQPINNQNKIFRLCQLSVNHKCMQTTKMFVYLFVCLFVCLLLYFVFSDSDRDCALT